MAKASVLDRLKALDEERTALVEGAKTEALDAVNAAIENLNGLGFNYRLVEGGRSGGGASRKGTRTLKDAPCPICKFKTEPLHDARRHRGQDTKKPFTNAELTELGLQKA